jgi:hypothetical protein
MRHSNHRTNYTPEPRSAEPHAPEPSTANKVIYILGLVALLIVWMTAPNA